MIIVVFGRPVRSPRFARLWTWAMLESAMHPVDYMLLATIGERVPVGAA